MGFRHCLYSFDDIVYAFLSKVILFQFNSLFCSQILLGSRIYVLSMCVFITLNV